MIGFDGSGHQVRDCLHPKDLWALIERQIAEGADASRPPVCNVSGGIESSFSLAELTRWCEVRWGHRESSQVVIERERATRMYDCPWIVLDSSRAHNSWGWSPRVGLQEILNEVAEHAESHPEWLELSGE